MIANATTAPSLSVCLHLWRLGDQLAEERIAEFRGLLLLLFANMVGQLASLCKFTSGRASPAGPDGGGAAEAHTEGLLEAL